MRAYIEIIKMNMKNSVVYRLDTAVGILGSIFALFVQIYLWKALLSGPAVTDISLSEMVTYQAIGVILSILYNSSVYREVGIKVLNGSISMELIKPYNFALSAFASTVGKMFSEFLLKGSPIILIAIFTFGINIKMPSSNYLLFALVIFMNILIYWLMHYIIGLLYFSLTNAGWFARILGDTIRVLGGGVIPLWFFPDILKNISFFLPFQLLYQFPQSLLINRISTGEIITNMIFEGIWLLVLLLLSYALWLFSIKRLTTQGG